MHDGCPAHTAEQITEHLDGEFGDFWIGTNGPWRWPPRSPDMTPVDFFLWGYIKNYAYRTPNIPTREEVWQRIQEAFQQLRANPQLVRNATNDVTRRMNFVIRAHGQHIEQYPKNYNFDAQYDDIV